MRTGWRFPAAGVLALALTAPIAGQTTVAVPKPFPQPGQPASNAPPATTPPPAVPPQTGSARAAAPQTGSSRPAAAQTATQPPGPRPIEKEVGVTIYPAADFLDRYDAGQGQSFYIFGTDAPYAEIVAYYKTILGKGGHQVFEAPAIYEYDLGRFQDQTMAFPPSLVIKDCTWNGSQGYLYVSGTSSRRYKTIIQIVPAK